MPKKKEQAAAPEEQPVLEQDEAVTEVPEETIEKAEDTAQEAEFGAGIVSENVEFTDLDAETAETGPDELDEAGVRPLPDDGEDANGMTEAEIQEMADLDKQLDEAALTEEDPGFDDDAEVVEAEAEALGDTLADIELNSQGYAREDTRRAKASQQRYVENLHRIDRQYERSTQREAQQQRIIRWRMVKNAYNRQLTLRNAKIIGGEPMTRIVNGRRITVPVAKCMIYGFTAYIPVSELFANPPSLFNVRETDSSDYYMSRTLRFINNMAGDAEIPVVIREAFFDADNKENPFNIVCSRRRAILKDTVSAFQHPNDRAARRTKPYEVGDKVLATVVMPYRNNVLLNVHGVDVSVPAFRLTNRYVSTASDAFSPGDQVFVQITNIEWPDSPRYNLHSVVEHEYLKEALSKMTEGTAEYNRVQNMLALDRLYQLPRIEVNARALEAAALFEDHGNAIKKNGLCHGIITYIRQDEEHHRTRVGLWLPQMELAALAFGFTATVGQTYADYQIGDRVEFQPKDVNDYGYLLGTIRRLMPKKK